MKTKRKLPAGSSIPNWLLYSGLGLVFSLGAIKLPCIPSIHIANSMNFIPPS